MPGMIDSFFKTVKEEPDAVSCISDYSIIEVVQSTDKFIKEIDAITDKKKKEIMEI